VTSVAPLATLREERDRLAFALRTLARLVGREARPERARLARERVSRLRQLLVEPLALPPDREVVVVPVDVLQSVPWSALVDAPVSLSPSASFWAIARQRPRPASGRVLLAAGPGLPAAESEVQRLSLVHDESVVLSPPHSTVRRVAEELEGASTAHFACHGVVRADNPMFSGLRLSDGLLTVQELELRDLAPYRVVLAACEASADISYTGGELLGFVSALVARGTAGVLGSIQLVPDEATAPFMLRVHEHLDGDATLATALHSARSSLDLENPADLVNWCGFTAYGAA
jgi:CHAT domain-containing protein